MGAQKDLERTAGEIEPEEHEPPVGAVVGQLSGDERAHGADVLHVAREQEINEARQKRNRDVEEDVEKLGQGSVSLGRRRVQFLDDIDQLADVRELVIGARQFRVLKSSP